MDAAGVASVLGAAGVLVTAITGLVVAAKGLRVAKEVKDSVVQVQAKVVEAVEAVVDVQAKVNGMHSNSMAREAQLTGVITDSGGQVPADPNVQQLSKEA